VEFVERKVEENRSAAAAVRWERKEVARVPEGMQGKETKREGKVAWWRLLLRRTTVARSSRACVEKMTGEWFGTEEVTGFRLPSFSSLLLFLAGFFFFSFWEKQERFGENANRFSRFD
jgi:hypothetical protein